MKHFLINYPHCALYVIGAVCRCPELRRKKFKLLLEAQHMWIAALIFVKNKHPQTAQGFKIALYARRLVGLLAGVGRNGDVSPLCPKFFKQRNIYLLKEGILQSIAFNVIENLRSDADFG